MIYTLYTGCTPIIAEPELLKSAFALARALDFELIRKREFSCCGGSHLQDVNGFQNVLLNARNLAYADLEGSDLVTICNTCQLVLSDTRNRLLKDPSLKARVNEALKEFHLEFTGGARVRHLLYAILEDIGLEELSSRVKNPLKGLKVASFYGCHNIRPKALQGEVNSHESAWAPRSLDRLVEALGGTPVYYDTAHSCCGFHISLSAEDTAEILTGAVLKQAYEAGADIIITPCPLCHTNLDSMQPEALQRAGMGSSLPLIGPWLTYFNRSLPFIRKPTSIPVLHFEQLVGIALGLGFKELGLNRHVISVKRNKALKSLLVKGGR